MQWLHRSLFLVIAALACAANAQAVYDPIASDPPSADAQYPAAPALLSVQSGGATLNGRGLIAQGQGPHPTVLLLHGFPGNELNMDLAQAMRRAGWNVFMFHYRGNWGSGGQYAFANVLEDTATVLAYLRTRANPVWRVDPNRIVLMGHSVGGFAALNTAAADPAVKSVLSIAGFDVARAGEQLAASEGMRSGFTGFVKSTTSIHVPDAEAFIKTWTTTPSSWKFPSLASKLAPKNVMLVAGTRDTVSAMPVHHAPLLQALKAESGAKVSEVVLDTDHNFSDKRIALMRAVLDWLSKQ
jgi:dipeptidyl aminopeptidase/acylaminoacyl peptidase